MASAVKKSGVPLLRLAHPLAFASYLASVGAPAERHMRRQRLPILCEDPNAFVPLEHAWGMFDSAARHEDAALGWRVGAYVGDQGLNVSLLRQLETAPTLLQALQKLVRVAREEASDIQLGLLDRPDHVLLYTRYALLTEHPGYLISQAYQLGVLVDLIRHFLGRRWMPDELGVSCAHIPAAARDLFPGSRFLMRQPMAYVMVPRNCLHRATPTPFAKRGAASPQKPGGDLDFVDTLRALLATYVCEGYPSARFAASLMNTSERTLARRLSDHGITYGALLDEVRFNAARHLLGNSGMPIGEIARSIGFEDQTHFARMFRRVGGLSPRQFRNTVRN